jgi:hypothetical protein
MFEDSGLLPTVWRSRSAYWGGLLVWLYRSFPMLHENSGALMWLVLSAFVIGFVRSLMLARARTQSTAAALGVVTRLRRTMHRQTLRLGPGDLGDAGEARVLDLFTDEIDRLRDGLQTWIYTLGRYPFKLVHGSAGFFHQWHGVAVPHFAGVFWWRHRENSAESACGSTDAFQLNCLLAESAKPHRGYGMEDFSWTVPEASRKIP